MQFYFKSFHFLVCWFITALISLSVVLEVVHSGYLGSFIQTRDSVKGSGCCGDGHQIPQSLYDQLRQGEKMIAVLFQGCIEAKQSDT